MSDTNGMSCLLIVSNTDKGPLFNYVQFVFYR